MRHTSIAPACAVALLPVVLGSTAAAATYQVGPTRTYTALADVADQLAAGDVVELDGDVSYDGGTAFWNDGSSNAPITIRGVRVNGNRPVLRGGDNTIEAAGDHYVFEGLEITGGVRRCFFHHADDVVLRDSLLHDCPAQGLLGADTDSGSLLMEYVEVTRCGGGLYDHQVYMATDETAHPGAVFRMQYCWVHDGNGGNNVKSRAERNEIYFNWLESAVYHQLELIGPDPSGGVGTSAREDSDVVGNVFVQGNDFFVTRFGGDGTGETFGRYRFVNNTVLVQPNASAVFRLFDGIQSVEMHNNVFAVDGAGSVNLLREVEANWSDGRQVAGSNNWVVDGSSNVPGEWVGTLTGSDAGFGDVANLDLRPRGDSPLVDAGSASGSGPAGFEFPSPLTAVAWHPPQRTVAAPGAAEARPAVGVIDVGAYEYGTGGIGGSGGTGAVGGAGGTGTGGGGGVAAGGAGGSATGGSGGAAASGSGGTGASSPRSAASGDDGGCGCRVPRPGRVLGGWALVLGLAVGRWRRRLSVAPRRRR